MLQLTLNLRATSEKFPTKRSRPIHETAEVKRVGYTRHSDCSAFFLLIEETVWFGTKIVLLVRSLFFFQFSR